MVGLFLAMLELIRDKLIWQNKANHPSQIYLRALTDERRTGRAEAILSVAEEPAETPRQARPVDVELAGELAIPIEELPAGQGTPRSAEEIED